ncbi:hypothetical protein RV03_GL000266 [Enterococcus gallinarum]|nr:hypothetical protein RV03_GL000266 [Enterococcus gallinarum]
MKILHFFISVANSLFLLAKKFLCSLFAAEFMTSYCAKSV